MRVSFPDTAEDLRHLRNGWLALMTEKELEKLQQLQRDLDRRHFSTFVEVKKVAKNRKEAEFIVALERTLKPALEKEPK